MKLPIWLYLNRVDSTGLRVRRYGSRRPLRLVLTIIDDTGPHPWSPAYLFDIGKLGLQFGSEQAVPEGHAGMPPGSRFHTWFLRYGYAIGISWDGGRV